MNSPQPQHEPAQEPEVLAPDAPVPQVQLKKLSPMHRQVLSMVAQGIPRDIIAKQCDIVPEYIPWLLKQPVCKEYYDEIMTVVDARLMGLSEQSVTAISEVLTNGTGDERLKAARLQLESIGRIGSRSQGAKAPSSDEHLEGLANRLVSLLHDKKQEVSDETSGS